MVYWIYVLAYGSTHMLNFYQEILIKTTGYYQNLKLNLIIPQLMIFINKCYQSTTVPRQYALEFLQLLNPLAPHLTEEI